MCVCYTMPWIEQKQLSVTVYAKDGIPSTAVQFNIIPACSTSVVSSSPCFFEAVSYAFQKFPILHVYVADVFVWQPTGQAEVFTTKLAFPQSWIFCVMYLPNNGMPHPPPGTNVEH